MIEAGFAVETALPLAVQAGTLTPAMSHGSLLLLRVANLMDAHEIEPDRSQERVEARLDLMLHWLGMQLFGDAAVPAEVAVRLEAEKITWSGQAPEGDEVVLGLHIHPAIAAPLKLAGRVVERGEGRVTVALGFANSALSDAWTQWLFRRHRRAVHEARSRASQA